MEELKRIDLDTIFGSIFRMIIIVGAGLSGATIAERYAAHGHKVLVIEKRNHIAGNVYDEIDPKSGIRISKYGAHLFHTNDAEVWAYVQRFGEWKRWDHAVIADVSGTYVPVPVNITTVNTLCGQNITSEAEMKEWLSANTIACQAPANSEEIALSRVGRTLYEALFLPYTVKQWAKEPKELDASVLERIPIRSNFDGRYFTDKFQALPLDGYTAIVRNMLSHPNITIQLNTSWEDYCESCPLKDSDTIIFTGPIDQFFKDNGLEQLEYRSINFEWSWIKTSGYAQPNSVVNYPSASNPYTRCVEYKHFLHQPSEWTILSKETTTDVGEPYYPVPTQRNRALYAKYVELTKGTNVHFIGRLATYKYFNMDQAIRAALDYYQQNLMDSVP
jgi:UDP-galactopyranose mutase